MKVFKDLAVGQIENELTRAARELLAQLGEIPAGGIRITLEGMPAAPLEQIARAEVAVDFAQRHKGTFTYRCMCGWQTDDVVDLVEHLGKHGARQLAVVPENWRPRE